MKYELTKHIGRCSFHALFVTWKCQLGSDFFQLNIF